MARVSVLYLKKFRYIFLENSREKQETMRDTKLKQRFQNLLSNSKRLLLSYSDKIQMNT